MGSARVSEPGPTEPVCVGLRLRSAATLIARLPPSTREAMHECAEAVTLLKQLGRLCTVVPITFLLLWPVLLPWQIVRASRALRLLRMPEIEDLLLRYRAELPDAETRATDDLTSLAQARLAFATGLFGPPTLVASTLLALWVALH